ncbi:MAG: tRNA dimethylallyltransferase [Patescibacteria group bacterium]|nr:tRNA dimethylallyltransferase [Patescibacteria group bacterium]
MKSKIVAIVGPTAVGKSDFAVEYALKNNGEIISADSRQVYKGLDIGTGKITQEEMKGIPHHLLDVADPSDNFNVGKFKELAEKAIADISSRGKLPIICGGTGFYIDAVVNNITYPDVTHNEKLREELEEKSASELFDTLKKLDVDYTLSLNNSEQNNPQRLIRSIEIATALGKVPKVIANDSQYEITWIKLELPLDELKQRIHVRLTKRLENGMIEEIENLHKNGLSWERMEELGLEYRYVSRFLQGSITKEKMIEQLQNEIWHYAKRQILWFKKIQN